MHKLKRVTRSLSNFDPVSVKLRAGTIRGRKIEHQNGAEIDTYKGIPYAQSPIGKLRFQPPQPVEKFSKDPLECFANGPACLQMDFTKELIGSEDCLHLNVYIPSDRQAKLPVMVWFHGGGFTRGSAADTAFSPEYLVAKGVLVVTVTSRLGPFGFLSFPEGGISGNAGLKDQQLALHWVSKNIESFGGDSENVTIFGQSSGAVSCHLHLLNEKSRNYFHKLICQSGCAANGWIISRNATEKAIQLAELVAGSKVKSSAEAAKILYCASGEDLLKCAVQTLNIRDKRTVFKMPFVPVVEMAGAEDTFLVKHPEQLLIKLRNDSHPMILGYNSGEGNEMVQYMLKRSKNFAMNIGRFIPFTLNIPEPSVTFSRIAEEVREFYYGDHSFSKDNFRPMLAFMRDKHYYMDIRSVVERHVQQKACAPLYFYEFAFEGAFSQSGNVYPGAYHSDELYYLFGSSWSSARKDVDKESLAMRELMCEFWTNFAKTGKPFMDKAIGGGEFGVWKKAEEGLFNFFQISSATDCKMTVNAEDTRRAQFWAHIHRKYGGVKGKL